MIKECQACGHSDLLEAETASSGGYGPALLPGTGSFRPAKFRIVVCAACGFVHWFVKNEDLDKVRNSKHFRSLKNR
jgi:predicted nucleic-acid-binding Zn-ribbon protein